MAIVRLIALEASDQSAIDEAGEFIERNWRILDDVINELNPPPGDLTGLSLVLSVSSFSAKLPNGLPAAWIPFTPGTTITGLIVVGSYTLETPDQATRFNLGVTSPSGLLTHVLDDVDGSQYDTVGGVGSFGTVELFDVAAFNAIWQKGNARLNITQTEGQIKHAMRHDTAGLTADTILYFDDVASAPTFFAAPSHVVGVEVTKFLSGIEYYTTGTRIDVDYTAEDGIFEKAYHPTQVSLIELQGATDITVNPGSVPSVNDQLIVTAEAVNLDAANVAENAPSIDVTLRKPDGQTAVASDTTLARRVNTYGVASTTTSDLFVDEAERLQNATDTDGTAWVSTAALVSGEAQVANGRLVHPNEASVGDYSGFSGDQEYHRRIAKTAASGGVLTLPGIAHTDVAPLGTGDVNVLLFLETDGIYFDLGRAVGDDNGTGDGLTRANSKGGKVSGSGSAITFSFLTFSTGSNSNQYRVIILFRATGKIITSLTGT